MINKLRPLLRSVRRPAVMAIAAVAASAALAALLVPAVLIPHGGPYSYAVYDAAGTLTGASVAADGQWRFTPGKIPDKFAQAVVCFEDRRFYLHPGIDLISILRAAVYNARAGRIVSGGSTITMQTIRLLEHNPRRTIPQKIKEAMLALLLELRYSKRHILELYSAHAPFGGNVVGLEAASWRWFGRSPENLTWAEAATLAVLPNQPSLVFPGSSSERLQSKRDALLKELCRRHRLDAQELSLALQEPLPQKPYPLPSAAPHYLELLKKRQPRSHTFRTTLDGALQKNTARILEKWSLQFARSGIHNAAAIVISTRTGDVLAYCGNTGMDGRNAATCAVDIIQARRSSGSLLKPFLYAAMLDNGMLLPDQLVIDIPTRIGSYKPDNNIPQYRGAVAASEALSRSLNIPAVRELRQYGISAFLDFLHRAGFTTFTRSADEYGLPLILGGGELTLQQTVLAYAAMMNKACFTGSFPASTGACYLTLDALQRGVRPADEAAWQSYAGSKRIAWKTGTSSGNRDAWAVGTTPEYTVGVWIGNARGQGSADLKSIATSAPVMFDIFSVLPATRWPGRPLDDLTEQTVCASSGYAAGPYCTRTRTSYRPAAAPHGSVCPYCRPVSLTPDGKYQATVQDMTGSYAGMLPLIKNYFVLPPAVEYWYTRHTLGYTVLPGFVPWHESQEMSELSIVFPDQGAQIILPVELDGTPGAMVMQAAERDESATVYWDIDGTYLGCTTGPHTMAVQPAPGKHVLTVTDTLGTRRVRSFEITAAPQ